MSNDFVIIKISYVHSQWYDISCATLYIPSVFVCSLRYPVSNAHAPYCHLWPAALYNICTHYLINGTIFERKVTEYKTCVLIFPTAFVWNSLRFSKKWASYHQKCILILMWSTRYSRPVLMKSEYSNIKFNENPSSGSRAVPCGQTDRHDEAKLSLYAILRKRLKT